MNSISNQILRVWFKAKYKYKCIWVQSFKQIQIHLGENCKPFANISTLGPSHLGCTTLQGHICWSNQGNLKPFWMSFQDVPFCQIASSLALTDMEREHFKKSSGRQGNDTVIVPVPKVTVCAAQAPDYSISGVAAAPVGVEAFQQWLISFRQQVRPPQTTSGHLRPPQATSGHLRSP